MTASATLAHAILDTLQKFDDPDLDAVAASAPAATKAPFTQRACAERLRSYAARRWLPPGESSAAPFGPADYARHGLWCVTCDDGAAALECRDCGERVAADAVADSIDAVHARLCAWRGAPLPPTVWDDDAASRNERSRALLERLDALRARDDAATAAALALAEAGWDPLTDKTVHCALCDRSPTVESGPPAHRCWCPRAKRATPAADDDDAAAADAGPSQKRARLS